MRLLKFLAVPVLALSLILSGCSALEKAQDASNIIGSVLSIAEAEKPSIPASEAAAFAAFVDLGNTLQEQLDTCIAGVSTAKAGSFLACFNSFASGLDNSTELAQLRVLSSGTQHKAQVVIEAVIVGVNIGVKAFGGTQVTTPVVGTAATTAELNAMRAAIGR